MAKRGRKSKYDTNIKPYLTEIKQERRAGATEKQIYEKYRVNRDSFYQYKKKFPEFAEILKESKEHLIADIKDSVFKTAKGGFIKTKKKYKYYQGKKILIGEETEVMAPNTTAQAMALKLLDPEAREALSTNVQVVSKDHEENQQSLFDKMKEAEENEQT